MADGTEEKDGETPEEGSPAEEASDVFAEVKRAIEEDRYADAEKLLDAFEERGAEWYYQRAVLCKKRSWYLESLRNLQEAVRLDPENEQYKQELEELDKMNTPEEPADGKHKKRKKNMGGSKADWGNACGEGCVECSAELCCTCICEGICEGLGNC